MAFSPSSPPCLRSLLPSPPLFHRQSSFLVPRIQSLAFGSFRKHELLRRSALREWREYEDAVKRKDLAGALRFLKSIENDDQRDAKLSGLAALELERDWQVLDACLNADDMRLVGSAFRFLKERGLLANFGKFSSIVLEGTREVTPTVLKSATGLEVTKLSPKKWGLSGASSIALAAFLGGVSYLLSQEIDVRPNLAVILGLAYMDSVFLGGTCLVQISCYWPPHKRRIIVHEAGHLLVAYLMGCPIRGVILDPIVAMRMGVQGQAGTQFWDQKMESEIAEGRLSGSSFDS
ncbi:PREDICTED: uncharacterized protein LOC104778504 isoform X3 [Camelina sativa]|nr:PREDICTED: uncharacterized protein LOC104778504 isoform X3 [Camelina sativa]